MFSFSFFVVFSKVLFSVLLLVSLGVSVFHVLDGAYLEALHALRDAAVFTFFLLLSFYHKKIEDWLSR